MRDLADTVVIGGDINNDIKIDGNISLDPIIDGQADFSYGTSGSFPEYHGEYNITPGEEAITLQTQQTQLFQNVTINPIPSNYGLITWDGHKLTVS